MTNGVKMATVPMLSIILYLKVMIEKILFECVSSYIFRYYSKIIVSTRNENRKFLLPYTRGRFHVKRTTVRGLDEIYVRTPIFMQWP